MAVTMVLAIRTVQSLSHCIGHSNPTIMVMANVVVLVLAVIHGHGQCDGIGSGVTMALVMVMMALAILHGHGVRDGLGTGHAHMNQTRLL